jgi:hypothetical protein
MVQAIWLTILLSGSARNPHVQKYVPVALRWRSATSLRRLRLTVSF